MHTMAIPALPYIIALEKGGEGGFEAHNEASDTMWQFVLSGANTLGRSKCFAPAATFPIPFSNHQSSHRSGNTGKGIASGKKQSQLSNNPPTILEISIKYRFILCFNWMPRRSTAAAPPPRCCRIQLKINLICFYLRSLCPAGVICWRRGQSRVGNPQVGVTLAAWRGE